MNYRQLLKAAAARFAAAGIPDPEVDASLLMSHLTGQPALNLRLDSIHEPDAATQAAFEALCQCRLTREPLQYILGTQPFWGRMFQVDSRVLIPRPETELLAEHALTAMKAYPTPVVLDLCCGSGCLAVTLALEAPAAQVHAADLSTDALDVTCINAKALGAAVTLHQGDLLHAVDGLTFDVIVSNPPYIPREDCRTLQAEVLLEPMMALDGGPDGLDFYRRIADESPRYLTKRGAVLLEVGYDQAETVAQLMRDAGFTDVTIQRDLNDIQRMVIARMAQ